jgi:hypothetical protein
MPESPLLPELGRSLRSLGTQRDAAGDAAHAAIFLPLLDARARAGSSKDAALRALRGAALSARIEAQAVDAAVHGIDQPARVRSLSAHTDELIEPLREALLALDEAAEGARDFPPNWEAWVAQLRRVFMTADVACQALAKLIASREMRSTTPRWYGRLPG